MTDQVACGNIDRYIAFHILGKPLSHGLINSGPGDMMIPIQIVKPQLPIKL